MKETRAITIKFEIENKNWTNVPDKLDFIQHMGAILDSVDIKLSGCGDPQEAEVCCYVREDDIEKFDAYFEEVWVES